MAQPQGPGQGAPLDPSGELRSLASDCVHCGFCLPSCPTYQLWGEEMDSPRGRIHLITQILDGTAGTAAAAQHLDRCLGCMACVTACPSGVRYDRLIEAARVWAEEPAPRPHRDGPRRAGRRPGAIGARVRPHRRHPGRAGSRQQPAQGQQAARGRRCRRGRRATGRCGPRSSRCSRTRAGSGRRSRRCAPPSGPG